MIQLLTAHDVPGSATRRLDAFPGAGICLESMDRCARTAHAALTRRSFIRFVRCGSNQENLLKVLMDEPSRRCSADIFSDRTAFVRICGQRAAIPAATWFRPHTCL